MHKAVLAEMLPPPARVLEPRRCPVILLLNPPKDGNRWGGGKGGEKGLGNTLGEGGCWGGYC